MHEQSETIQDAQGRWINVYGRGTPRAGQPLPPVHDFEQDSYDSVEEAVAAAILHGLLAMHRRQRFGARELPASTVGGRVVVPPHLISWRR